MDADHIRELTLERAKLMLRLAEAYRLIGAGQLYVQWYGEQTHTRGHARKIAIEMKEFVDGGLFGDGLFGGKGKSNG